MSNYEKISNHSQAYNIVSGVLSKNCIFLIAETYFDEKKDGDGYDEWSFPKDCVIYIYSPFEHEKGDEWWGQPYGNLFNLKSTSLPSKGLLFIGLAYDSDVFSLYSSHSSAKFNWIEGAISHIQEREAVITDVAVIADEVYASASGGAIYQRITDDNWQEIALSVTETFFSDDNFDKGFNCLSGFSADEIYAGGDDGILWLRDKGNWRPIELPVNEDIGQIICASDGNVYIKCLRQLLKGRKDKWEVIKPDIPGDDIILKIAWFKDELYILPFLASATGLYAMDSNNNIHKVAVGSIQINPDNIVADNPLFGLEPKHTDTKVFIPAGRCDMVANDDLLMITGSDEVILFNGQRWFYLFDKGRSEEELRASGTFYDPREL